MPAPSRQVLEGHNADPHGTPSFSPLSTSIHPPPPPPPHTQVYDVQPALDAALYGELDGRAAAVLGGEGAAALRQHWGEMLLVGGEGGVGG